MNFSIVGSRGRLCEPVSVLSTLGQCNLKWESLSDSLLNDDENFDFSPLATAAATTMPVPIQPMHIERSADRRICNSRLASLLQPVKHPAAVVI